MKKDKTKRSSLRLKTFEHQKTLSRKSTHRMRKILNNISDKILVSREHKELLKFNNKKVKEPNLKIGKELE